MDGKGGCDSTPDVQVGMATEENPGSTHREKYEVTMKCDALFCFCSCRGEYSRYACACHIWLSCCRKESIQMNRKLSAWLDRIVDKLAKRNATMSYDVVDITSKYRKTTNMNDALTVNAGVVAASTVDDYKPE